MLKNGRVKIHDVTNEAYYLKNGSVCLQFIIAWVISEKSDSSPVVSDAVMGSEVTSPCIVMRLMVYGVDGSSPWTRDLVLEPSSVTLEVSVPSEEL